MYTKPTSEPQSAVRLALRALADSATMVVWLTDASGACIFLNPQAAALVRQCGNFRFEDWTEFIAAEDRAPAAAALAEANAARGEYRLEYRVVRSDGTMRWLTHCGAPRFSAGGDFLGYGGAILDMVDREARDELRKSEARFRDLINLSSDWYWETDEQAHFSFVSEGVRELFGFEAASLIGKTRADFAPGPDDPGLLEYMRKFAAREPFKNIRYAVSGSSKGSMRFANISGAPVYENDVFKGFRGVGRDITDEIEVGRQLALLAAENKALVENSLDMLAVFDAQGRFVRMNEAAIDILGHAPHEMIGRHYAEFIHPEDRQKITAIEAGLRTGKNTVLNIESRWMRKDGGIAHLSWAVRWSDDKRMNYATARDITETIRARSELQKSKERLRLMLETIGDAFFAIDRDWRLVYANQKTADFVGRSREALIGNIIWEAIPEIRSSEAFRFYQTAMKTRSSISFETFYEPAGTWVEARAYPLEDGLSVYFHDISARRGAQRAIHKSEQRFRELFEMTPAGYLRTDENATLTAVNPALCRMSGYTQEELLGRGMSLLFPQCPCNGALFVRGGARSIQGAEAAILHKQGHYVYVLLNANVERDAGGNGLALTAFVTDITERKQAESRLRQLATHDMLTGLPNRALLNERVQGLFEGATHDQSIAVMFLDLDRFKEINDSLGHESGDILLREVGRRLQACLRTDDLVARLGGDEFVVVSPCPQGAESAKKIAGKLFAALAAPVDVGGQEVFAGASIGISLFPQDGNAKELLFQNADTAMYRAKAAGGNGYRFFEAEMSVESKTRMALETALRRALERKEFELHYQPRIDLKSMAIVGMEALIRWNHPQLGKVPPMQFIPLAEERGLIEAIGRWVLEEACTQSRRLMDKFQRPLRLSVNVSARQLRCANIVEQVRECLDKTGLAPELLELELTESTLVEDIDASASVLKRLKTLGLSLSVDDFGTGYSGLSYLRNFPLDTLKLDRSFVVQQEDGISSFRFIKAFVDMAHALNLSVVAEGIETKEMLQFLRDAACDEAQGYLLARPMSLDAFETYLARLPGADGKPGA
jgi:diguanylate cyclase (GGDEF)-like protein/PAS domain S-box-containing protein